MTHRWTRVVGLAVMAGSIWLGAGCSYNKFTTQEEAIKAQWAQVENQLQRRNDLIPNLVETVKGFAEQEQAVFEAVADARAKMAGAQTPADEDRRGQRRVERARAAARRRRELPAAQVRRAVRAAAWTSWRARRTASRTERMRYNETVQEYNTARKQFPANITAKMFGFKEYPYFEVPADAEGRAEGGLRRGRGGE